MNRYRYAPMKPYKVDMIPDSPGWGYEIKWDGYRVIGYTGLQREVELYTSGGHDFTAEYPAVAAELPDALQGRDAVVDGEMVAFDDKNRDNYMLLRLRKPPVVHILFDLLELDGERLTNVPLWQRRETLQQLVAPRKHVVVSDMFDDRNDTVIAAIEHKREGVIAKWRESTYRQGKTSRMWQKLLLIHHPQGFVR